MCGQVKASQRSSLRAVIDTLFSQSFGFQGEGGGVVSTPVAMARLGLWHEHARGVSAGRASLSAADSCLAGLACILEVSRLRYRSRSFECPASKLRSFVEQSRSFRSLPLSPSSWYFVLCVSLSCFDEITHPNHFVNVASLIFYHTSIHSSLYTD